VDPKNPAGSPVLRPLIFDGVQIGVFEQLTAGKASRSKATSGRQASSRFESGGRFNGGGRVSAGGSVGETFFGKMKPESANLECVATETNVTNSQLAHELVGRIKRLRIGE
jgi:hypothetical protein